MKILIFIKSFDGGTGTFVNNFLTIKKLNSKFDIKIAALEKPSLRKINNNKIVFFADNKFYPEKYSFSLKIIYTLIKELFWFKKIIYEYKPDIILTIDSHCLILGQFAKYLFFKKAKLIATIHNNIEAVIYYKVPKLLTFLIKKIINYSLNKADKVVCVSNDLSNHIFKFLKLKSKPITIYYGLIYILKKTFQKPRKINHVNTKNILTISRLSPQKDIKTLINAFKLIKNKLHKVNLLVVGDGPQKNELKNLVKKLKLKNVYFTGWLNNPINLLNKIDLFVLSSHWEGLPYSILETMSQGLPIISTDTPFGPREILDNGKYGILVPMNNPQAMADAMYELLTDEKKYRYYSQKSLDRVKYFSIEKMLNAYKKLITLLLTKPG